MNRRSGPWIIRILAAVAIVAAACAPGVATAGPAVTASSTATMLVTAAPPTSDDDILIDSTNPFLPEDRDLTECIGTVERPGCGSEARGGWGQNLVALAMVGGLVLVFGRVAWAVRRSQKNTPPTPS